MSKGILYSKPGGGAPAMSGNAGQHDVELGYTYYTTNAKTQSIGIMSMDTASSLVGSLSEWTEFTPTGVTRPWSKICYGINGYVAIDSSTTTSDTLLSKDGLTWTKSSALYNYPQKWTALAFGIGTCTGGEGRYVLLSSSSTKMAYSKDGINWTEGSIPDNNNWTDVCFGDQLFVAIASNGTNQVMTSTTGTSWTARKAIIGTSTWQSICYGAGKYVAVASSGADLFMYSFDGITWTRSPSGITTGEWVSVKYGNGIFMALDSVGTVAISLDGVMWTTTVPSMISGTWCNLFYGNGVFLAVTTAGSIVATYDGKTWSASKKELGAKINDGYYANGKFVLTCANQKIYLASYYNKIKSNGLYQTYIEKFAQKNTVTTNIEWTQMCYGKDKYVAITANGGVAYSIDNGSSWTTITTPASSLRSICYAVGKFIAVGWNMSNMYSSIDGISWNMYAMPEASGWNSVCYGNGMFVAVALSGNTRIATSYDGINWSARTISEATNGWCSVCYGNGMFVAIANSGTNNKAAYSTNGINWTVVSVPEQNQWQSVTYGNGRFVAVANTGTNRVMYSNDGKVWTIVTNTNLSLMTNSYIYFTEGLFIAISNVSKQENRVMYSIDGIVWNFLSIPTMNNYFWQCVAANNAFNKQILLIGADSTMKIPYSANYRVEYCV